MNPQLILRHVYVLVFCVIESYKVFKETWMMLKTFFENMQCQLQKWLASAKLFDGGYGKWIYPWISKSSHQKCSVKKLLLEITQYSQENTCVGVSF